MYPVKKNILQLVALLKAHNVKQIVLSPGSRNAPLIQAFSQDPFFNCHTIVDERNAGFYALGIIQATQEMTAICCTSGTALLNYTPAVAEAYYQKLPLIVISADRAPEWIGQMDGQTVPQNNVFVSITRKSVNLPEIETEQNEWYCNRLINEAIIICDQSLQPVHINIPISEPLFDYSVTELPEVRKIIYNKARKSINIQESDLANTFINSTKRVIIVGQLLNPSTELKRNLQELAEKHNCVIFCEHLSNCVREWNINNFDLILHKLEEDEKEIFAPDLLISFGGHIVSKRLKHFLRSYKTENHWHLTASDEIVDLYQNLTNIIETDIEDFLSQLIILKQNTDSKLFNEKWLTVSQQIEEPQNIPFSDILTVGKFIERLPSNSVLHLANSSSVRNAQLFSIDESVHIYCNRGTNGIESSLPSTIGFASVYDKPTYLIIGDLSFFYTIGSLWNIQHINNLRILLINNNCGGIFHLLPGLNQAESLRNHVAAQHNTEAKKWAEAAELKYLSAKNEEELNTALTLFTTSDIEQSILLEVSVDMDICSKVMKEY